MSRGRPPLEQGSLFDLELDDDGDEAAREQAEEAAAPAESSDEEPSVEPALDVPLRRPSGDLAPRAKDATAAGGEAGDEGRPAPGPRFLAGALDAGLHLLLGAGVLAVLAALGVAIEGRTLAASGLVLLLFSFFYTVISLAFWGATPGMSAVDLSAEAEAGEPLAFGQAARRWLAGVLTVASAGLPALLVFSGRSLGDRWSRSSIVQN